MKANRAIAFGLLLLLVAACAEPKPSGKYHRWFNPEGQQVQDVIPPATCEGEIPPPIEPPPPPRPNKIPQGWNIATYTLAVDSMKIVNPFAVEDPLNMQYQEYCIPVSLFVYITGSGIAPELQEFTDHGVVTHQLPYNGLRYTPWRATLVVAWDPNSPAPVMNMEHSAKYEIGEGLARAPAPTDGQVGLMCRMRQNGITFAMSLSFDIFKPPGTVAIPGSRIAYVNGPFVKCRPEAFSAVAG